MAERGVASTYDAALAEKAAKPPLDLLEPVANEGIARALEFGANKYGVRNYAVKPLSLRSMLAAMQRHIDAMKSGEIFAPDSGVSHADHIGADIHVIDAAEQAGTLIDDRGPYGPQNAKPVERVPAWQQAGGYVDRPLIGPLAPFPPITNHED